MSNTEHTQNITRERRKVVQITVLPSVYRIAKTIADREGSRPGRIIERGLLKLPGAKAIVNQES